MVCLWDGLLVVVDWLPVVSTLDTLPACEGVGCAACGGQFPRCCLWMVSLWDVLPVPVGWWPWSVPSTPCQPVSLCRGQYPRHIASGEGVGLVACSQYPRHSTSL